MPVKFIKFYLPLFPILHNLLDSYFWLIILFLYALIFQDLPYLFLSILVLKLFTIPRFPFPNLLLFGLAFAFPSGLLYYLDRRCHPRLRF